MTDSVVSNYRNFYVLLQLSLNATSASANSFRHLQLKTYHLENITWIFSIKPLKILIGPQTSLGEWPKTQEQSA